MVRAETHRDVFEKLKMFTISPNCSLDHLEQAASNAKTEKKIPKNGNKIFRQSVITDYCIDLIYCS